MRDEITNEASDEFHNMAGSSTGLVDLIDTSLHVKEFEIDEYPSSSAVLV